MEYTIIEVPDLNDSMSRVVLNGKAYLIRFTWNDRGGFWKFGLYDTQSQPIVDLLHRHYLIGPGRVQAGGVDGVDDGIPLHIRMEEPVHAELKKFPQNADGHGKAKRNHGQKEW